MCKLYLKFVHYIEIHAYYSELKAAITSGICRANPYPFTLKKTLNQIPWRE